jgi:hypothetical protein
MKLVVSKKNLNITLNNFDEYSNISLELVDNENFIVIKNIFRSKTNKNIIIDKNNFLNYIDNFPFKETEEKSEVVRKLNNLLLRVKKRKTKIKKFYESLKFFNLVINNKYIIRKKKNNKSDYTFRNVVRSKLIEMFLELENYHYPVNDKIHLIYSYIIIFHLDSLEKNIPIEIKKIDANSENENNNLDYFLDNY